MSGVSKRVRSLNQPTGNKKDYKVLAPYFGSDNHDDAVMSLDEVVKTGIDLDPSIVAFLEKNDLKDMKNLNLNAGSDKPISEVENLFKTADKPTLNGGYIAYCSVYDGSVVNDIAASMQLSANVTYQLNDSNMSIAVKNFYFLVIFYENGVLKSVHTVVNNRLLLTLIALNEKASQGTSTTQSDWSQTDAAAPSFIKNKPTIPTVVPQQQADWSQTDATAPSFIKNKPIINGGGAVEQSDWSQTDAAAPSFIKNKPTIPTVVPQQQADWAQTDSTAPSFVKNKPTIPTVVPQQQADWAQTDSTAPSFVKNKPKLANVATSGSYQDLIGTPDLHRVATSGNYNDLDNRPSLFSGNYNDLINKPIINSAEYNFEVAQIMGAPSNNLKLFAMATIDKQSANMNFSWQPASSTSSGVDRLIIRKGDLVSNNGKCRLLHAIINTSQMLGTDKSDVEVVIEDYMGWIPHVTNGASLASTSFRRVPSIEVNAVEGEANDAYSWHTVFSPNFNIPIQYQWANDTDLLIGIYNVKYLNRIAVYLKFNS